MDKANVISKIVSIFKDVTGVDVNLTESSLFGKDYNIPSELFVYVLLEISKAFEIEINNTFVNNLAQYSIDNIADAVITYKSS